MVACRSTVTSAAVWALALAATSAPLAAEAGADEVRRALITAHGSDHTPRIGQQFVVRGLYDGPGRRRHEVKIQTYRHLRWLDLKGARVTTRADDSYRVRVVLHIRGVRDLRAVGMAGPGRPNSYARFVVEVHR
jgi:hypothetical protein